ncbi:MAG: hypothetical protein HYU39_05490 [Thaumarchaeota archaeon]|nr:hypothetical protein [Nitrososphaerota archaeon]
MESSERKKQRWILKKYDDLAKSKKVFDDGKLMFQGKYLMPIIHTLEDNSSKRPKIQQDKIILSPTGKATLKDLIRQWFKAASDFSHAGQGLHRTGMGVC